MTASCSLDSAGFSRQAERYAAIGRAAVASRRTELALAVELGPSADDALVEETLAIERECCPFFELGYEPDGRMLSIAVPDASYAPALDALAEALSSR